MLSIFTIFDIQIRQQYLCFVLSVMYIHAHIEIQIHTRFLRFALPLRNSMACIKPSLDGIGKVKSSSRASSSISLNFHDFS